MAIKGDLSNNIAQKLLLLLLGGSVTLGGYIAKATIDNGRQIAAITAMLSSIEQNITRHENTLDQLSRKYNDLQQQQQGPVRPPNRP